MIKSVFFDIIKDPLQRDDLNFLKDKHKVYELFCKNGYTKDFDSFEKELNEFLSSDEVKRVLDGEYFELSDEMLEMVSGGFALRKFLVGGVISLMAVSTSAFALPDDFENLKTGQTHISMRMRSGGDSIGSGIFGKKRKSENGDDVEDGENQEENDHEIVKCVMNELQGVVKKIAKIRAEEKNLRKNRQKDDNDLKKLVNDELEEALEKFVKIRSKEQKSKKNPQRSGSCFGSSI